MSLDTATRTLLRETLHEALVRDAPEDVLGVLEDLGWDDVLAADEATATDLLFGEQGATLSTSAALDTVVLRAAGIGTTARRFAYPVGPDPWIPRVSPGGLEGALVLGPVAPGEPVVVPVREPAGPALVVVDVPPDSWAALDGIDPDAGWSRVDGPVREVAVAVEGAAAERAMTRARAAAHRALSAEIIAVARGALEIAVTHVGDREQFGRPVGTFQTVRHRLAEAHARLCGSEALLEAAWVLATDPVGAAEAAATAKASAGATHAAVLGDALQVCGAMGLTWEHPLHRHARRGFLLDALLGGTDDLVAATGRALLAGHVPVLAPLPGADHPLEDGRRGR